MSQGPGRTRERALRGLSAFSKEAGAVQLGAKVCATVVGAPGLK